LVDAEGTWVDPLQRLAMTILVQFRPQPRQSALLVLQKALFYYWAARWLLKSYRNLRAVGVVKAVHTGYVAAVRFLFSLLLKLPSSKRKVAKELAKAKSDMINQVAPPIEGIPKHFALPVHGRSSDDILEELDKLSGLRASDWQGGRVSGAVYFGDQGETPSVLSSCDAILKLAAARS
jgi:sphinganine-1-phosphate aldolase